MPTATVTSKGQITLPAETRRRLRIVPGTRIDFVTNAAGETVLKPKRGDIRNLAGILGYDGPAQTLEEIDAGIAEAVAERVKNCK